MITTHEADEAIESARLGNTVLIYTNADFDQTCILLTEKGHKPSFKKPVMVFNIEHGQIRVTRPDDIHLNDHRFVGHLLIDTATISPEFAERIHQHHIFNNPLVHPYT